MRRQVAASTREEYFVAEHCAFNMPCDMIVSKILKEAFLMTKEQLLPVIYRVMDKLMNLGGTDWVYDKTMTEEQIETGLFARDFGIEEWEWPQAESAAEVKAWRRSDPAPSAVRR